MFTKDLKSCLEPTFVYITGAFKLDSMFLWDGIGSRSYSLMKDKSTSSLPGPCHPHSWAAGTWALRESKVDHVLSKAFPLFDSFKNQSKGKRKFGMKFIFKVGPRPQPQGFVRFSGGLNPSARTLRAWQSRFQERPEIFEITQKEREGVGSARLAVESTRGVAEVNKETLGGRGQRHFPAWLAGGRGGRRARRRHG